MPPLSEIILQKNDDKIKLITADIIRIFFKILNVQGLKYVICSEK